jgi:Uncharacterized protein conserved in bacteria
MDRRIKILTGIALVLAAQLPVHAQDWPSRPIKIVTEYATGGTSDLSARLVADRLSRRLNTPVIVENRPGASGRIAGQMVASAPADGYTLLWTAAIHTVNPAFFSDMPYDTQKDFTPVVHAFAQPVVMSVPAASPARSVEDFVRLAKSNPKYETFGHSGVASVPHLTSVLFANAAGIKTNEVAYKGDTPAMTDLLGGHVPVTFTSIGTPAPHVASGKLRALAVSGAKRSPLMPQVPTFTEAGFPGMENSFAWFGLVGPARLPPAVVERLNKEINEILQEPDLREQAGKGGNVVIGGSAAQFKEFIANDIDRWRKLAVTGKVKVK